MSRPRLKGVTIAIANPHEPAKCWSLLREMSRLVVPDALVYFGADHLGSTKAHYDHFMCKEIHWHIKTRHVLILHLDGYILRPDLWDDRWLEFDYIGAPWPETILKEPGQYPVGNGGFCLRSLKLMRWAATRVPYEYDPGKGERIADDVWFASDVYNRVQCRNKIKKWEKMPDDHLMIYAPPEIAGKFSVEIALPGIAEVGKSFGFHSTLHGQKPWYRTD